MRTHTLLRRRVGLVAACVAIVVALTGLGGCEGPKEALKGLKGETELTFAKGAKKGAKEYIVVENVSPSNAAELGESFMEEGGKRQENVFKVAPGIKSGAIEPCKFPTEGQELEKKGDNCDVGVELVAETAATGTFVLWFGGLHGNQKEAKVTMNVKSE
jgi:hypothetical protein